MKAFKIILSMLLLITLGAGFESVSQAATVKKVSLVQVVDGDTLKVKDPSGKVITLRLLLIDTPESVKPGVPVQPFSKEASASLAAWAKKGNLTIEYDKGAQTDMYGRHLVYLYTGKTMINDRLVYNGFARVGYIYGQRAHLDMLRKSEQFAKSKKLRIWEKAGYVNAYGEGFITPAQPKPPVKAVKTTKTTKVVKPVKTVKPVKAVKGPTSVYIKGAPKTFSNCKELNKYYPYGITKNHPSYTKRQDRDGDGLACEKN